mmetsp:Transcript_5081/g.16373  ORF Transcript_5081/g.16373 Transcript_5081/m.16373 type:complete len:211 (-) Transcript_5081:549-1181(-)
MHADSRSGCTHARTHARNLASKQASPPPSSGGKSFEKGRRRGSGLQEVRHQLPGRHGLRGGGHLLEDPELPPAGLVDVEDGRNVAATVAIVRCGPDGHEQARAVLAVLLPLGIGEEVLVALLDELVRPRNQVEPVESVEVLCRLLAKQPAGAPGADRPVLDVLRVRPDEVAKSALVGDLLHPVDRPDLVQQLHVGRQAAVDAEDGALDYR